MSGLAGLLPLHGLHRARCAPHPRGAGQRGRRARARTPVRLRERRDGSARRAGADRGAARRRRRVPRGRARRHCAAASSTASAGRRRTRGSPWPSSSWASGDPREAIAHFDQIGPTPIPPIVADGDPGLDRRGGARRRARARAGGRWSVSPHGRRSAGRVPCTGWSRAAARSWPRVDEAEPLFHEALELHAQDAPAVRARPDAARLRGAPAPRPAQDRGAAQLRSPSTTFEGLGAAPWAERARGELNATGESARKRDASTIDDLTPQELRIAQLVAGGASNRDAAAQLFVSPKTVEYHLRKVFLKLGAVVARRAGPRPARRAGPGSGLGIHPSRSPPARGEASRASREAPRDGTTGSQSEMATYLYRLGGWAFGRRRTVLLAWVDGPRPVVASAMAFSGQTNDKFSVPGTESQQAQDLLEQKFPGAGGASARMVFAAPEGEKLTDQENKDAVEASLARPSRPRGSRRSSSPYEAHTITKDGADRLRRRRSTPCPPTRSTTPPATSSPPRPSAARDAGLQVEFGGGIVTEESKSNSESMGMMIGFVVLAITLGSLLAAGLPLLTALLGVLVGVTGLTALIRRLRRLRDRPDPGHDARPRGRHRLRAVHPLAPSPEPGRRAASPPRRPPRPPRPPASAVVFAGMTVVIALVGLTVVNIPFLTVMGLAAAGTVDDRRAHRDHAAARHPRLRRGPRGPRQPRARLPPAAQAHRRASRWAPAGRAS